MGCIVVCAIFILVDNHRIKAIVCRHRIAA